MAAPESKARLGTPISFAPVVEPGSAYICRRTPPAKIRVLWHDSRQITRNAWRDFGRRRRRRCRRLASSFSVFFCWLAVLSHSMERSHKHITRGAVRTVSHIRPSIYHIFRSLSMLGRRISACCRRWKWAMFILFFFSCRGSMFGGWIKWLIGCDSCWKVVSVDECCR